MSYGGVQPQPYGGPAFLGPPHSMPNHYQNALPGGPPAYAASMSPYASAAAPPPFAGAPLASSAHAPFMSGPLGQAVPMQPAVPPPVPYEVVRKQVTERLNTAIDKRHELVSHLDELTEGQYSADMKKTFSASRKAGLDDVDWRVPRLMRCKDPKYNGGADGAQAVEVQQRKVVDSQVLEEQLANDATERWTKALQVVGERPPPTERTIERRIPFVEARPNYVAEDDVWSRTLELRTLDEAMRGDVSKPLPRPAVHTEEYQNFHEGKYVKDDCPIA